MVNPTIDSLTKPKTPPKLFIGEIKITPELAEEIRKSGGKISGNVKDIMEMNRQYNALLTIRGRAIDNSLNIERQLEYLICSLLFENQVNRKGEAKFFENFILNTNHLTFSSKLKIFRSLYKICSYLQIKAQECSELATKIQKVMEIRDNFAHSEILFKDIRSPSIPYLFYYKDNEPKEQKLDNVYFDHVNLLYQQSFEGLIKIRHHINKCFEKRIGLKWNL